MKRQLFISALILTVLIALTAFFVMYARGYRFDFNGGRPDLSGTGLLVATSSPDGAQVFINGHLTTATDNTINLAPGEYEVRIFKEGYFEWKKKLIVKKEVVTKADALLFPTAPKLESLTNTGVSNPVLDPAGTKLAYTVASQAARRNGVYTLDMSVRPILTLQSASVQLADDTLDFFSNARLSWSPNGAELMATISGQRSSTYLLTTNGINQNPQDVSQTLTTVNLAWAKQKADVEKARTDGLPKRLRDVINQYFDTISWSTDNTKILYSASAAADLPIIINPRLVGVDSTPEDRKLKKDSVYVYDVKEDKNYKILDSKDVEILPKWFPDSKHLIYVHDQKIDIMEFDAQNQTTVYAGPFVNGFVFPWADTSRIVVLTNLGNPTIIPNLYTISLR